MRLVISGGGKGESQMALDEALLLLASHEVVPPTVRLWNFSPTTLSIGRFLAYEDWVNDEARKNLDIPVVRRFTGGGPALHDEDGEITWTIVGKYSMIEAYQVAGRAIERACRVLGVEAEFTPINDVEVQKKKICGMAGASRRGFTLVHGTFMFDTDLSKLSVIRQPTVKESVRGRPSARVTTISNVLGRKVSRDEAMDALLEGFSFLNLEEGEISTLERDVARELEFKYSSTGWLKLR